MLEGKRGAHMHSVIRWFDEEARVWIVQHKNGKDVKSLGRFRKAGDANDVACRKMADLQKQFGNQRGGIKLKPRVDLA